MLENFKTPTWCVVYMGLAFFTLFSGYTVYRSFLPSLKPTLGPVFIAINYLAYAIGSLLPSKIISNHRRFAFACSATTYPIWIICLQFYSGINTPIYFNIVSGIVSIANGFAAGVLWSTKGGWLSSLTTDNNSFYNGIFLAFYGASGLFGNIAVAIAVYNNVSTGIVTISLAIFSIIGLILLAITPYPYLYPSLLNNKDNSPQIIKQYSEWTRLTGIKRLFCRNTGFIWLILPIFSLASSAMFVWVILPKTQNNLFNIAIAYAFYALINSGISLTCGKILKNKQEYSLFLYSLNSLIIIIIYLYYIFRKNIEWTILQLTITTSACGIVIAIFTLIIYTQVTKNIVVKLVENCPEVKTSESNNKNGKVIINPVELEPFAIQNVLYCTFYAILSGTSSILNLQIIVGISIAITIMSVISFWVYTKNK